MVPTLPRPTGGGARSVARAVGAGVATVAVVVGCSADPAGRTTTGSVGPSATRAETDAARSDAGVVERYPDVIDVDITSIGDRRFRVSATLSSSYDSPERYADAWRVLDDAGNELGIRELAHDHADEQPFTRDTTVVIPVGVDRIRVQGRDQVSGYGGATVTVEVPAG